MNMFSVLTSVILVLLFTVMFFPTVAEPVAEPVIKDSNLKIETFVSGLSLPTTMAFVDEDILVLEKETGEVRLIRDGKLIEEPVLELNVNGLFERGLLGILYDEPFVYLYYTEAKEDGTPLGNRIYKYTWNGDELLQPILVNELAVNSTVPIHNGGVMVQDKDGTIFTVVGDANRRGLLQNFPTYLPSSLISNNKPISLIDDNLASWFTTWTSTPSTSVILEDHSDSKFGTNSLQIQVNTIDGHATILHDFEDAVQDWSEFTSIEFWFKGQDTKKSLGFAIYGEPWEQLATFEFVDNSVNWKKVEFDLTQIENRKSIRGLEYSFYKGIDNAQFSIDNIQIVPIYQIPQKPIIDDDMSSAFSTWISGPIIKNIMEDKPIKQIKAGIQNIDVKCSETHVLVLKSTNKMAACVKNSSLDKLTSKGWAIEITKDPSKFVINLLDSEQEISGKNSLHIDLNTLNRRAIASYDFGEENIQQWSDFDKVSLWLKGENTKKNITFLVRDQNWANAMEYEFLDDTSSWKNVIIPISNLNNTEIRGLSFAFEAGSIGNFLIDDIRLIKDYVSRIGVLDDTSAIIKVGLEDSVVKPSFSLEPLEHYYAIGLRNSFGLAVDPITGKLWNTENGPEVDDEINLVEENFNSGWDKITGFVKDSKANLSPIPGYHYSDPEFSWDLPIGVTAISFVDSPLFEEYKDAIFVGDVNGGNLYVFRLNEDRTGFVFENPQLHDLTANPGDSLNEIIFGLDFTNITDIKFDSEGNMYVVGLQDGAIYKITPDTDKENRLSSECDYENETADLSNCDFSGQNLAQIDLQNRNLSNVNFNGANLSGANLQNANLVGSNLAFSNLSHANINGANLTRAQISGADLTNAKLVDADLLFARIKYTNLGDADLTNANLKDVKLNGADLRGANLSYANLFHANTFQANFENSNLSNSSFELAYSYRAIFNNADLSNANLTGATLNGVKFINANLVDADLSRAKLSLADFSDADLSNLKSEECVGQGFCE